MDYCSSVAGWRKNRNRKSHESRASKNFITDGDARIDGGHRRRLDVVESAPELPERVLDFTSTNLAQAQIVLDYLPKDTSFASRRYVGADGAWAIVNVILMGADRTSIHRPDYCLPGQGWQIRDKTEVKLNLAGVTPYELPVMKWILRNTFTAPDGSKQDVSGIYVFWFVTEHQTTDDFPAMLRSMLLHQLTHGVLQRWAYVSYFTACQPGQEDAAFARMKQLITAAVPGFQLPPATK